MTTHSPTTDYDADACVWATVVTRNRLNMLKNCIQAIREQSRKPDTILVVDNESDDGTAEWLSAQADLRFIRQANTGSSGGQYAAFKHAYENGANWTWTMDDDVLPLKDTLENLLKAAASVEDKASLLASRVVGRSGNSVNVAGIDMSALSGRYADWERYLADGIVAIEETTFVSILVPRSTITQQGYPLKELFIWGDDTEFSRRCRKCGPAYLVGNSVVRHLRPTDEPLSIWNDSKGEKKQAYWHLYRNHAYIARRHKQHLQRRNQLIPLGPASYCVVLALFSLKSALKHKRLWPLLTIAHGTISGLFVNFEPEVPAEHG